MMTMNSATSNPDYETVFTVQDYHDGPRSGVANFHGLPHVYTCVFDNKNDEYSDLYVLTPIHQEAFKAALENWEIFLRWRAAFDGGKVSRETYPALPQDKTRYEETKRVFDEALVSQKGIAIRARGDFEVSQQSHALRDVLAPWLVKWSE